MRVMYPRMNTQLSEMVEAVMDSYGWSETDLGKEIGVSQSTVNRMRRLPDHPVSFQAGLKLVRLYEQRPEPDAAA